VENGGHLGKSTRRPGYWLKTQEDGDGHLDHRNRGGEMDDKGGEKTGKQGISCAAGLTSC